MTWLKICTGADSSDHIAVLFEWIGQQPTHISKLIRFCAVFEPSGHWWGLNHHLDNASSKIGAQIVFYILNGIYTPKSSLAAGWRTVELWGLMPQVQLSVQPPLFPANFFLSSRLVKSGDSPTNAKGYGQMYKCRFIAWRITLHSNAELYSGNQSWMHC